MPYFALFALALAAGSGPDTGVPVHFLVTLEHQHDKSVTPLTAQDVMASEGKDRLRVVDLTPVKDIQLKILIDEGLNSDVSLQFSDLSSFVRGLSAGTEVGIEYMRNGSAYPTQALTTDHERAVKALRLPVGDPGESASPYMAISDVIKKWPAADKPREILVITSGIDLYYPSGDLQNPYLERAIADAQRAGIPVYSIYFNDRGHLGHSYWRISSGQNYLSMLADGTGAEMFWQGLISPVSFQPFLDDLSIQLGHQYVATVLAKPEKKSGLDPIKVRTETHGVELRAPEKVYVPGDR